MTNQHYSEPTHTTTQFPRSAFRTETRKMNKALKWSVAIGVPVMTICFSIFSIVKANYDYEKNYSSNWSLSVKSSSIAAKSIHIEAFVNSLEAGNRQGRFASHAALFLRTADNSFNQNLASLKTLRSRLNEITRNESMDQASFQYSTAIQQITVQEQGAAKEMLGVFQSCFILASYPLIWNWIQFLTLWLPIIWLLGLGIIELGRPCT